MRAALKCQRPIVLEPGQYAYRQGDSVNELYILIQANTATLPQIVDVVWKHQTSGRTLRIERVRAPALLGHVEVAQSGHLLKHQVVLPKRAGGGKVRLTSVQAVTDVQLVRIPYATLDLLASDEVVALSAILGQRAAEAFAGGLTALHDAFVDDSTYRLAAWLYQETLSCAREAGGGGQTARTRPLPQEEIAKQVGLRRDTLNQKLKDLEASGIISLLPSREIVVHDTERLDQLADLAIRENFATFATTRDTISDALLAGNTFRARNLALDALAFFPSHPELRHLAVLAALRCGAAKEARGLLAAFGWDGELDGVLRSIRSGYASPRGQRERLDVTDDRDDDEEDADEQGHWQRDRQANERRLSVDIPSLSARLAKDAAFTALHAGSGDVEAAASDALARYSAIADRFVNPYAAVNAAAMSLLAGMGESARAYAERAITWTSGTTYWDHATLLESQLLLGQREQAIASARDANATATIEISRVGMIASTRLQLRRLMPVCGSLAVELRDLLRQKRVVYAAGHLPLKCDRDSSVWIAAEEELRAAIKRTYADLDIGAVFCALAAGSDILLAEQALEAGASVHVVLPVPPAEFLAQSVLVGNETVSRSWRERFQMVLEQAATVTVLEEDKAAKARLPFDQAVYAGSRHAAGLALLHADQWESEAVMVSVHDGSPPGSMAGTSRVLADWQSYGHRAISLACSWRNVIVSSPSEAPPTVFGSALFVWLAVPGDHGRHQTKPASIINRYLERAEAALKKHLQNDETLQRRVLANQMIGFSIVLQDVARALTVAFVLSRLEIPDLDGLRITLDFGGIFRGDGQTSEIRLAALTGARDDVERPLNSVIMTEAFAAQHRLQLNDTKTFFQIGTQTRKSGHSLIPRSAIRYFSVA